MGITQTNFTHLSIGLLLFGTLLNAISLLSVKRTDPPALRRDVIILQDELPSIDDAVMKFEFAQHYDITADDEWGTIFPPDDGKIVLGDTEYHVSMYLQLKCLDIVRGAFVSLRDAGIRNAAPRDTDWSEAEYCLDVLRQTVLCIADTTLEPGQVVMMDGKGHMAASGNHVEHVCRDWSQVRTAIEENQKTR